MKIIDPNGKGNDPERYNLLSEEYKSLVQAFIAERYQPAATVHRRHSYLIKHDMEDVIKGPWSYFYISNGAFKGAMLAAGYQPVNLNELNWYFRIKPRPPWCIWNGEMIDTSKRKRGVVAQWKYERSQKNK